MATTVSSINSCDGAITLASSVPGILGVSNNPTAPYTITLAPINANVGSLNGKLGAVVLASPDNTLAFAPTALGSTINISGYVAGGSGGAGSALLQAQNLTGALAWAGGGSPVVSTVAYAPGALVISGSSTYVCLVAQPIGSVAPTNGANWQSIGGGSGGTPTSIANTGASLAIDTTGTLTYTNPNTASNINQINLTTVVPTTTPGVGAGAINITAGSTITLSSPQIIDIANPTANYASGGNLMADFGTWSNANGYLAGNVAVDGGVSYVCIINKSPPTPPATNPVPSADPTYWQPLGSGAGGSSIVNGGSTLALNATGGLSLTTTDVASNTNTVSIATIIPSTTPGTNAGRITVSAGADLQLGCALGDMTLTNTAGAGLGGIILSTANKITLVNTGTGGTVIKPGAGIDALTISPPTTFGAGVVPYNCGVFNNQYGYNVGSIVQETSGGGSYVCILAVAPNTTPPYNTQPSATPANWLPLGAGGGGMELAPGASALWSDTQGYPIGSVVNNTTPTGIYVCIQTVPTATPPATNPNPSSSPTYWTELISNTTAPGSAMVYDNAWSATQAYSAQTVVAYTSTSGTVFNFICILAITAPVSPAVNPNPDVDATHWLQFGAVVLSTSWSNTEQYNVGTILNDPDYGSFNCILTAPVGSPAPWLQTTPVYWASLTQGYCYFYGDYDLTGATPYPVGSIVNSGGSWWICNTIYVPPVPPVVLPPLNSANTNWSFFVSTVNGLNALAITDPYPVPPALPSGSPQQIETSQNVSATPPFTAYTGNLGNTGFVVGGTGIPLIPGSRYNVSYNINFNGIPNNNNISSATWSVRLTFNMTSTTVQATSYYQIHNTGDQGGSGNAVPSATGLTGSFNFTAPVDATYVGVQVQNVLNSGSGMPVSTTSQFCNVAFNSLTSGLVLSSLG